MQKLIIFLRIYLNILVISVSNIIILGIKSEVKVQWFTLIEERLHHFLSDILRPMNLIAPSEVPSKGDQSISLDRSVLWRHW